MKKFIAEHRLKILMVLLFLTLSWKMLPYIFWFLVMLSIVVFVHEFGHFIVARYFGVKVEVFSIGFGQEIYGWNDRYGTRWKIAWLPFGGYVKMFGDADPASSPDFANLDKFTKEEKRQSFYFKHLYQKALVVFAGPAFNYLLAILILTWMYGVYGKVQVSNEVTAVENGSPAEEAGILPGDLIVSVDGNSVKTFNEIKEIISVNVGDPIALKLLRNGIEKDIVVKPINTETKDVFGNKVKVNMIGVKAGKVGHVDYNLFGAFAEAGKDAYRISAGMLKTIGQMLTGSRGLDQLGGPVSIAKYSGQSAQMGAEAFLWFIALISINLGLVNLFPIPMLDGGHLLFYFVQKLMGREVPQKAQAVAFKVGVALLMTLMFFVTFQDIKRLIYP
jgi:regulator of sigma E protease